MILRFIANYYYQLVGVIAMLLILIYIVQSAAVGYIDRYELTRRHRATVQAAALLAIVLATVAAGAAAVRIGRHTWRKTELEIIIEELADAAKKEIESRQNQKPENIGAGGDTYRRPGESCDFSRFPSSVNNITPENAINYTTEKPMKSSFYLNKKFFEKMLIKTIDKCKYHLLTYKRIKGEMGKGPGSLKIRKAVTKMKTFTQKTGIKFCTNHTGKMEGMGSLSTSPLCNARCIARSTCAGLVCSKCYSMSMQAQYTNLSNVLKTNSAALTKKVIPVVDWPILNYAIFRIESFGDVSTVKQVQNYFNLARRNPRTIFAAWTKNVDLYRKAVKLGARKPKNFILIESSPALNDERKIRPGDIVDKVFTVYDKQFLAAHPEIEINCGARNCLKCQRCYRKGGAVHIREVLK